MKLAIGTAQFGARYGANAAFPVPDQAEITRIVQRARELGIDLFDTASAYGRGLAESRLGQALKDTGTKPNIVTKILLPDRQPSSITDAIDREIDASLGRLGVDAVYGLLLHRVDELLAEDGDCVYAALKRAREDGRCRNIGVSVYEPDVLAAIRQRWPLDLVQCPSNVFDQTFLMAESSPSPHHPVAEIHIRSLFLQGTLLMPPERLGGTPAKYRDRFRLFSDACTQADISQLQGCLAYAWAHRDLFDACVVGVHDVRQLDEIHTAWVAVREQQPDLCWSTLSTNVPELIRPYLWKQNRPPA